MLDRCLIWDCVSDYLILIVDQILAPAIYKNYMETMVDYLEKKPSVQAFVERKTQIGLWYEGCINFHFSPTFTLKSIHHVNPMPIYFLHCKEMIFFLFPRCWLLQVLCFLQPILTAWWLRSEEQTVKAYILRIISCKS